MVYDSDILVVYKRKSSTLRVDDERVTRFTVDVKGKDTTIREKNNSSDKEKKSTDTGWYYLGMFGQIGFSIALPIAGCAILGKMADAFWMSSPKWTLIGLGIGITVSVVTFIHTVKSVVEDSKK
jgi:ATP synthase protein I